MTFDRINLPNRPANLLSRPFQSISLQHQKRLQVKCNKKCNENSRQRCGGGFWKEVRRKWAASFAEEFGNENSLEKEAAHYKCQLNSSDTMDTAEWTPLTAFNWPAIDGAAADTRPIWNDFSEMHRQNGSANFDWANTIDREDICFHEA